MIRYRQLDANRDYVFGQQSVFLHDSPAAVAQAILTRLLLWTGEWFLDTAEGTPYDTLVLGYGTQGTRDAAVRERILATPGVVSITKYNSSVVARGMSVECDVLTEFGPASITSVLG